MQKQTEIKIAYAEACEIRRSAYRSLNLTKKGTPENKEAKKKLAAAEKELSKVAKPYFGLA